MPSVQITLRDISVEFSVPKEHAAKITKSDLHEMACAALGVHNAGKGVQVIVNEVCQFAVDNETGKEKPVFANVFVDGPFDDEIEVDSCDDEFEALLAEDPDICG